MMRPFVASIATIMFATIASVAIGQCNDISDLKKCIEGGIESRNEKGRTPLHDAAMSEPELARALIEAGADIRALDEEGMTPLHFAASGNAPTVLRALVEAGADIEARKNEFGWTPLHFASEREAVNALVEAGADIDARDSDGDTPLHVAASRNEPEAIRA